MVTFTNAENKADNNAAAKPIKKFEILSLKPFKQIIKTPQKQNARLIVLMVVQLFFLQIKLVNPVKIGPVDTITVAIDRFKFFTARNEHIMFNAPNKPRTSNSFFYYLVFVFFD